jgi:benzoyl-CoA reductase subunit C
LTSEEGHSVDGQEIIERCLEIYEDMDFNYIREWKDRTGGQAIGILPMYFPKEILHAAGLLPVELYGGGDMIDVVKGDSFYQSYICHIPRSMIDLGLSGKLEVISGLICPFTCDVIRNFTGVWGVLFPDKYVRFFDQPQNYAPEIGGEYLISQLKEVIGFLEQIGKKVTNDRLNKSIKLYNQNRKLIRKLYKMRANKPWQIPTDEVYLLMRAGGILEVTEFNQFLIRYMDTVQEMDRKPLDNVRVVISGAFCEQPPLNLIKVIELAGCYVVDDDFILGNRYLDCDVEASDNPLKSLSHAYLNSQVPSSCRFEEYKPKSERLVKIVKERNAEGVIFAAPSFCDPALEDRPSYQHELEKENIRYMSLQYSEESCQFGLIREQIGTFADSIKLWEA